MKKIRNLFNNNKFAFTFFIVIAFILFDFITTGINGLIFKDFHGILYYITLGFDYLYRNTYFGTQFIGEMFWFICLIPVLIIFKNKYIFTQKKRGLIKSLLISWPVIFYTLIVLVKSAININFKVDNPMEILSLAILCFLIGLFEELLCRGWLQNEFIERFGNNRKGVLYSIFVSGLIFGIMHISNALTGQSLFETLIQVIAATITGISLGAVYYKTKNIWSVIILHAFWDFSIFLGEVNVGTSCITLSGSVEKVTPILGIFVVFVALIASIPEIGNALRLLGKKAINDELPQEAKEKYTKEQLKDDRLFKKIIDIILIVYLGLFALFNIIAIGDENNNSCPTYTNKYVKNYSETIVNYKNYNIELNKNTLDLMNNNVLENYNIGILLTDDSKLNIINKNTSYNISLDFENVLSFMVIENNNDYKIYVIVENEEFDNIVYESLNINLDNINNDNKYIDDLKNSFKQVMLPYITEMGYYIELDDNYKYPLFVSKIEDRYIVDSNNQIYILK